MGNPQNRFAAPVLSSLIVLSMALIIPEESGMGVASPSGNKYYSRVSSHAPKTDVGYSRVDTVEMDGEMYEAIHMSSDELLKKFGDGLDLSEYGGYYYQTMLPDINRLADSIADDPLVDSVQVLNSHSVRAYTSRRNYMSRFGAQGRYPQDGIYRGYHLYSLPLPAPYLPINPDYPEDKCEIIETRTPFSRTFINVDGSFTVILTARPTSYPTDQDGDVEWVEIPPDQPIPGAVLQKLAEIYIDTDYYGDATEIDNDGNSAYYYVVNASDGNYYAVVGAAAEWDGFHNHLYQRAFNQFPTTSIPGGATVQSVIYRTFVSGEDPDNVDVTGTSVHEEYDYWEIWPLIKDMSRRPSDYYTGPSWTLGNDVFVDCWDGNTHHNGGDWTWHLGDGLVYASLNAAGLADFQNNYSSGWYALAVVDSSERNQNPEYWEGIATLPWYGQLQVTYDVTPRYFPHLTITSNSLRPSFGPLTSYLDSHFGMPDTIVAVEDIYTGYPGRDNQEKIRNLIIHAYQNWETQYVLLGGDVDIVPCRKTFSGVTSGDAAWNDTIPCDLYYSDLDRTWDENGNNVFGEPADNVDMYPDVYVGRATVNTAAEVTRFIGRVTTYSLDPDASYLRETLLAGFDLDSGTHGETTMEYYDDTYISAQFNSNRVYDSHSGDHCDSVLAYFNAGQNIAIHTDHGNIGSMGCGYENHGWLLYNGDMSGMVNSPNYAVFTSQACLIGAFDQGDCIMEAFLNAPAGGAVATMTNSRFGWYQSDENPQVSLSGAYLEMFVQRIFGHSVGDHADLVDFHLGKQDLVAMASSDNYYRWCMYALNLFGEPTMEIWPTIVTGVEEREVLRETITPEAVRLRGAYPNPSSKLTTIIYELPSRCSVTLAIYDISGRLLRTLVDESEEAGCHTKRWDARLDDGSLVSSGVYFYRLEVDGFARTQKVTLLR